MTKPDVEIIDVSAWVPAHEETLGTKPKRWLQNPSTDVYWLMKDTTFNRRKDGSLYPKGDDWSEWIASRVARHLGLPAAQVEFADGGPGAETARGIITLSFLADGESLLHGNELLEEIGITGSDTHDRMGYDLVAVRSVLDSAQPPEHTPDLSAWEVFVGYLVLDAVLGNVDRHQENWAVVARDRSRRLAPTFDHASCLGFQLDDDHRIERLESNDRNRHPEAYANRARSRFDGEPPLLDIAAQGLRSMPEPVRRRWLDPCAQLDALDEIASSPPATRISEPSREFARRMLRHNATRLLSQPLGTVTP